MKKRTISYIGVVVLENVILQFEQMVLKFPILLELMESGNNHPSDCANVDNDDKHCNDNVDYDVIYSCSDALTITHSIAATRRILTTLRIFPWTKFLYGCMITRNRLDRWNQTTPAVSIFTHTRIHKHVRAHTLKHTHANEHIYIYTGTQIHTNTYHDTGTHKTIHTESNLYTRIYTQANIQTHIYTYTQAHTHIQTHTRIGTHS